MKLFPSARWLAPVPALPALLLVSALLLPACGGAPTAPERVVHDLVAEMPAAEAAWEAGRVDLGTPAARAVLGAGWGRNERGADGRSFVWSLGREATLELFVLVPRDLDLVASVRPLAWPGAPPQRLAFFADRPDRGTGAGAGPPGDVELAEVELAPEQQTVRVRLPAAALVEGRNVVTVRHAWSRAPAGVPALAQGGTRDRRSLAAAWDWLQLVPPGAEADREARIAGPRRLPERGKLVLAAGTRVDFFLPLPAGSTLAAERLARWDGAELRVEVLPDGGTERLAAEGAGPAEGWRLPLTGEASLARLRLEVPPGRGAVALERPRIVAPEGAAMPPEALAASPAAVSPAAEAPRPAAGAPRLVVLYVIDTLRADRLGAAAAGGPVTPHLDAFAADAVVFESARAQSPWTQPSMASVFTGLWPAGHGTVSGETRLPADLPSLPRLLAAAGYRTGAAVANGYVAEEFGFAEGFERFTLLPDLHTRAEAVQEDALAWLDEVAAEGDALDGGRPVFLYLHTIDPHAPYDPPPPMHRRFAPGVPPQAGSVARMQALADRREVPARPAEVAERLAALYDGDVAWQDVQLGRFLDALRRRGLYEEALIVVVSDHGEEFGEHGRWTHGLGLHHEVLDVPLLVRWPGARHAGTRVAAPAQHVDLLPTILAAAGLPRPPGLEGIDLATLAAAADGAGDAVREAGREPGRQALVERPVFSHLDRYNLAGASVELGRWKLILPRSRAFGERPLLYDRRADPAERRDLAAERPVLAGWLATAVRRKLAEPSPAGPAESAAVGDETRRRLRALGYLH